MATGWRGNATCVHKTHTNKEKETHTCSLHIQHAHVYVWQQSIQPNVRDYIRLWVLSFRFVCVFFIFSILCIFWCHIVAYCSCRMNNHKLQLIRPHSVHIAKEHRLQYPHLVKMLHPHGQITYICVTQKLPPPSICMYNVHIVQGFTPRIRLKT